MCHIPSVQFSEPEKHHQDCLMLTAHLLHGLRLQLLAHPLTCGFLGMCYSPTRPGMSLHVISYTRLHLYLYCKQQILG